MDITAEEMQAAIDAYIADPEAARKLPGATVATIGYSSTDIPLSSPSAIAAGLGISIDEFNDAAKLAESLGLQIWYPSAGSIQ